MKYIFDFRTLAFRNEFAKQTLKYKIHYKKFNWMIFPYFFNRTVSALFYENNRIRKPYQSFCVTVTNVLEIQLTLIKIILSKTLFFSVNKSDDDLYRLKNIFYFLHPAALFSKCHHSDHFVSRQFRSWETVKERQRDRAERQSRETERQRDRETERQRDRETERQRDRETERQRDRDRERETERERERERDRERQRERAI